MKAPRLTFWYTNEMSILAPLCHRIADLICWPVWHRALDSRQRNPEILINVNVGRIDVSMDEPVLVQPLDSLQKLVNQKPFLE
jgi:hypothetical protein